MVLVEQKCTMIEGEFRVWGGGLEIPVSPLPSIFETKKGMTEQL